MSVRDAVVEIGSVAPGRVVEVVAYTLNHQPGQPRRALVWSQDFNLTRVVWLDGWQATGEDHLADCWAVRVLDEVPPPHVWRSWVGR